MYTRMLDVYGIVLEGEEVSVIMEYANGKDCCSNNILKKIIIKIVYIFM